MNVNTGVYGKEFVSTQGCITKREYQLEDTWPSVNINMGILNKVRIVKQVYITNVNINMGTHILMR